MQRVFDVQELLLSSARTRGVSEATWSSHRVSDPETKKNQEISPSFSLSILFDRACLFDSTIPIRPVKELSAEGYGVARPPLEAISVEPLAMILQTRLTLTWLTRQGSDRRGTSFA
jgi:hypothetical protein